MEHGWQKPSSIAPSPLPILVRNILSTNEIELECTVCNLYLAPPRNNRPWRDRVQYGLKND